MNKFYLAMFGVAVFSSAALAAAPPPYVPPKPAVGPCFWQVPGEQRWVNLNMIRTMKVVEKPFSGPRATYEFVMNFDNSREASPVEIKVPLGADTGDLPKAVMKRIQECAGKE